MAEIFNHPKLDFDDVLIVPSPSDINSRSEVSPSAEYQFEHSKATWLGTPIVAANMVGVGTMKMASVLSSYGMLTCLHKHYEYDEYNRFFTGTNPAIKNTAFSMGTSDDEFSRLRKLWYAGCEIRFICIDVANGYTNTFLKRIEEVRALIPSATIIAGNVVTARRAQQVFEAGADIVKVGIGPGSVCTTRLVTGVGYPQLSAIMECTEAINHLGGFVMADGGCRTSGDIAKAMGAGASFVMLGGMLAAHDECELEKRYGKYLFYGMSTHTARQSHGPSGAAYRASEGRVVSLEPRGSVIETVESILGGVKSACSYVGAENFAQLSSKVNFVRVNNTHNRVYEGSKYYTDYK